MKILLVGYGYWGKIWEKTINNSDYEIYDIIDPYIFNNNINTVNFNNFDSVIIASPINTHLKLAELCIQKNKNVLIEKPGTTNLEDLQKLKNIKTDKNIGIGYVLLYCSGIQKIKKLNYNWKNVFFYRSNGSSQIRSDCDVVYDLLCHDIAIAYYIFQVIPKVIYNQKKINSIYCILKFNDTNCHFYCSRNNTQKLSSCNFINDNITIDYNDITKTLNKYEKNNIESETFQEYPLNSQLSYLNTKFITNLDFAEKVHYILQFL